MTDALMLGAWLVRCPMKERLLFVGKHTECKVNLTFRKLTFGRPWLAVRLQHFRRLIFVILR